MTKSGGGDRKGGAGESGAVYVCLVLLPSGFLRVGRVLMGEELSSLASKRDWLEENLEVSERPECQLDNARALQKKPGVGRQASAKGHPIAWDTLLANAGRHPSAGLLHLLCGDWTVMAEAHWPSCGENDDRADRLIGCSYRGCGQPTSKEERNVLSALARCFWRFRRQVKRSPLFFFSASQSTVQYKGLF